MSHTYRAAALPADAAKDPAPIEFKSFLVTCVACSVAGLTVLGIGHLPAFLPAGQPALPALLPWIALAIAADLPAQMLQAFLLADAHLLHLFAQRGDHLLEMPVFRLKLVELLLCRYGTHVSCLSHYFSAASIELSTLRH